VSFLFIFPLQKFNTSLSLTPIHVCVWCTLAL
jgi:hypothetical protein